MPRPGAEAATAWSKVRCHNRCVTKRPNYRRVICGWIALLVLLLSVFVSSVTCTAIRLETWSYKTQCEHIKYCVDPTASKASTERTEVHSQHTDELTLFWQHHPRYSNKTRDHSKLSPQHQWVTLTFDLAFRWAKP